MKPETALEAINKVLFPPLRMVEGGLMIDDAPYSNLDGVRIDLERMGADRVCICTIEKVQNQLMEISTILRGAGCQMEQR